MTIVVNFYIFCIFSGSDLGTSHVCCSATFENYILAEKYVILKLANRGIGKKRKRSYILRVPPAKFKKSKNKLLRTFPKNSGLSQKTVN